MLVVYQVLNEMQIMFWTNIHCYRKVINSMHKNICGILIESQTKMQLLQYVMFFKLVEKRDMEKKLYTCTILNICFVYLQFDFFLIVFNVKHQSNGDCGDDKRKPMYMYVLLLFIIV